MSSRLVFVLFCACFLLFSIAPQRLSAQSTGATTVASTGSTTAASKPSSAAPVSSSVAQPTAAVTPSLSPSPAVPSTPTPKKKDDTTSLTTSKTTAKGTSSSNTSKAGSSTRSSSSSTFTGNSGPPDVHLNVPNLSVKRIELDVDNLKADINLNANVANLVSINAGVALSVKKINLTIADVEAKAELIVRLGHLVEIVNRVFSSLDLNPLLITALDTVTGLVDTVVGAVDGLLGSITQGGSSISFLVDNLGNIVQQVVGAGGGSPVTSIVGNYQLNMTYTGVSQNLQNGLVQKTYSYSPLNAMVNIVFNSAGNIVQATVVNKRPDSGGGTSPGGSPKGGSPKGGPVNGAPAAPSQTPTGSKASGSSSGSNPAVG